MSERSGLLSQSVERVLVHLSEWRAALDRKLEVFDQVVDALASIADVFFVARHQLRQFHQSDESQEPWRTHI